MTSQKNKYIFCGCKLELICDEPVAEESTFSLFGGDFSAADYSVTVKRVNSLPPQSGMPVYSSPRRKLFVDGRRNEYTAYYDITEKKYIDFACKTDDSVLYISYPGILREVTVFDGLNLPDMLLRKNIGILHCSFIEYDGKAILFTGRKQIGKSTQAALWEKYNNAQIINGDRAAIFCENGRIYACGIPFCGTSGICKNKKLPLNAVICLSQGRANSAQRISGVRAYTEILSGFTYNCQDTAASDTVSDLTEKIVKEIPVYAYSCLKDESAAEYLKNLLIQHF